MDNHNDVKFLHFRRVQHANPLAAMLGHSTSTIDPRGGVTLAFRTNPDGTITYAPAMCSMKDNFSREEGRRISSLRVREGGEYTHTTPEPITEKEFSQRMNFELGFFFGLTRKYSRNRKARAA